MFYVRKTDRLEEKSLGLREKLTGLREKMSGLREKTLPLREKLTDTMLNSKFNCIFLKDIIFL